MSASTITHPERAEVLLTDRQLAVRWQCSPGSLRNARSAGVSPVPYLVLGSRTRYRLADALAYEAASGGAA
jgi:hypothetical protein